MRVAALLCVLATGCTGRTEIVVGVVTDLKARNQMDLVRFQALRNGTPVVSHDWPLADIPANQYELPGSFGIYSPDGSAVRVELSVTGWRADQPVVERTSLLSLIPGQTLFLRMGLVGDCGTLDGPTCSDGESCIEGVCRPKEMDPHRLPSYRKELVDHVDCQSGTRYIVSTSGELMPSDGTDCAADEYCQEGVCLKRLPSDPPPSSSQPEWVDTSNPSPAPLRALGGDEMSGDVYAVGEGGAVLHGSGGGADPGWLPDPSPVSTSLFGVWVGGPDDVFACGSGGVVIHKKGNKWTLEPIPVAIDRLDGIWGVSIDDLWAVGRASGNLPAILHRVAGVWSAVPSLDGPSGLKAVWGRAADDVWAVGSNSHVQHFDGKSWTRLKIEPGHDFLGVGGNASGVFLVGRKGLIARASAGSITLETAPVTTDLFALWGAQSLYAVGDYGKILYSTGDGTWKEQISGTEAALFAVYGLRGQIFAAGRMGKILRADGMTPAADCYSDADCPNQCTGSTLVVRSCQGGRCVQTSNAACAGGFACAADGVTCLGSCGADSDCQAAFFCDAGGLCKTRLQQGTACDTDTQCKSAGCRQCADSFFCTDHVCCDKSPAQCGGCMQCNAPTGTCDPVAAGEDPRGTCAGMTAECTQTKCNGRGTCNNTGNVCGTNSCSTGMLTTHACDDGTCKPLTPVTCANSSPCADGTSCAGKCADDMACPSGYFCNQNGDCAAQKNKGGACNVTAYNSANNPNGHCKTANCRECNASQCVDGYCCDSPCGGQCQACDLLNKEGTCSPVLSAQPHGTRAKCLTSDPTCAGFCSSMSATQCTYPTGACGSDSCNLRSLTTHSCGGGTCNTNAASTCSTGYVCNAAKTACSSAPCSTDADCDTANDYYCSKSSSTCVRSHAAGGACSVPNDCKSGTCHLCVGTNVCAFGVCCESACSGSCQMCNSSGKCVVNTTSSQPVQGRSACQGGAANCGQSCDGVNTSCQWAGTNVVCSGPLCSDDHTSSIAYCTGSGKCNNPTTTLCGPTGFEGRYACEGSGSCVSSCGSNVDCAANYLCNTSQRYCGRPNGQDCAQTLDCVSGNCWTQKVCCDEYCTNGSSGYACVKMDSRGIYHAWAKGTSCSTGACAYSAMACATGAVCIPAIGRCDANTPCKCKGALQPDGRCDSDYCDRANNYLCYEARGICLNMSP